MAQRERMNGDEVREAERQHCEKAIGRLDEAKEILIDIRIRGGKADQVVASIFKAKKAMSDAYDEAEKCGTLRSANKPVPVGLDKP